MSDAASLWRNVERAPPGSPPQEVEARRQARQQAEEQAPHARTHEASRLLALQQRARQLRVLVRDPSGGPVPTRRATRVWTEDQLALTQWRMEQHQDRCQAFAAHCEVVQLARAVARRPARQSG